MAGVIKSVEQNREKLKKGTVLFEEGEPGDAFYIVKTGRIGIYHHYQKEEELEIAVIEPTQVLGEVAAIDGKPRTATAVVLEDDTHVIQVEAKMIKNQLMQCPQWLAAIVLDLVERLRRTDELLIKAGGRSLISSSEKRES